MAILGQWPLHLFKTSRIGKAKRKKRIANESDPQKSAMLQDKYKILANAYTQNAKAIVDDVWSYDEQRTGKTSCTY